jgi:hypothetical protein
LEKVQRQATTQIPGMRKMEYEERLKIFCLTTLQDRRKRVDMFELHKMLNGFTKVLKHQLFEMRDGVQITCGNVYLNLFKHHTCLDIRKNALNKRQK